MTVLGVTFGCPAGIGPEVMARAIVEANLAIPGRADADVVVYAPAALVLEGARRAKDYPLLPVREMFLGSKVQHTLIPILKHMNTQGVLRSDWRAFLKAALFCCPFLTMNLADESKFSPEISLLGLAMAVEMGAESSDTLSRIDVLLNGVEQQLD